MATGYTDPQRRERILATTLELIAQEGIAGVSHRKIAARAGVPLGSMTYHFHGIDEVLREAFRHFTDHIVALTDTHLTELADQDQARTAVVDLIHVLSDGTRRDFVLIQELYTLATREAYYRELVQRWTAHTRSRLEAHFDPDTACQLDALIKGLALHRSLLTTPHDSALTFDAVTRITTIRGGGVAGGRLERPRNTEPSNARDE
ncbi:TetR/AcrR family transcriptional regulator [Streptomyces sp. NPDC017991]|uniref:TetR/AcrR family transcriptional regulator n=1 Tax=Streptomyces sp. NPDC017991 TaxID=3365026 RepID=UPI0037A88E9D